MVRPAAIVFDFGGVLFRWQPRAFLARMLPHRTATPEAAEALFAGVFQGYGGDWADFDRGRIEPGPLAQKIATRLGLPVEELHTVIGGIPGELEPIAESVALLRRLHAAGHPLYFLSNMPAPMALHLERTHEFLGLFRHGVFSGRVDLIKPEPAIFEHAARTFGIEPAHTLFIDDHADNVIAARGAGWQALHFTDAARCEAELKALALL